MGTTVGPIMDVELLRALKDTVTELQKLTNALRSVAADRFLFGNYPFIPQEDYKDGDAYDVVYGESVSLINEILDATQDTFITRVIIAITNAADFGKGGDNGIRLDIYNATVPGSFHYKSFPEVQPVRWVTDYHWDETHHITPPIRVNAGDRIQVIIRSCLEVTIDHIHVSLLYHYETA